MSRKFVAEEVARTVYDHEKFPVSLAAHTESTDAVAMTPFNVAYLQQPNLIEVICLLSDCQRFTIADQSAYLGFAFLQRSPTRGVDHLDTLATLNQNGQLRLHRIGALELQSQTVEIPGLVKGPMRMHFLEQDMIVLQYEGLLVQIHYEQEEWRIFSK